MSNEKNKNDNINKIKIIAIPICTLSCLIYISFPFGLSQFLYEGISKIIIQTVLRLEYLYVLKFNYFFYYFYLGIEIFITAFCALIFWLTLRHVTLLGQISEMLSIIFKLFKFEILGLTGTLASLTYLKLIYFDYWADQNMAHFTGIIFILTLGAIGLYTKILMHFDEYRQKLKLHDLNNAIEPKAHKTTDKRRVVIGYNQVGKEIIKDIVLKEKSTNAKEKNYRVFWSEKGVIPNVVVIEKDELKVPHVVGDYKTIGKIGYDILSKNDTNNSVKQVIPILIGDARSPSVQEHLQLSEASTISFATLNFRSNIAILETIIGDRKKDQSQHAPTFILPCRSHSEQEVYQRMLTKAEPERHHEVIRTYEYIGTKIANLIRIKLKNKSKYAKHKILLIGRKYLYSTLEALFAKRLIPHNDCELLVMDWSEENRHEYGMNKKNMNAPAHTGSARNTILSQNIEVSTWKANFVLPDNGNFHSEIKQIPVVTEPLHQCMNKILDKWQPHLIVIFLDRKSDIEKVFHHLFCYNRLHPEAPSMDIVTSTACSKNKAEITKLLLDHFNIPYGTYSYASTISREISLVENMTHKSKHS